MHSGRFTWSYTWSMLSIPDIGQYVGLGSPVEEEILPPPMRVGRNPSKGVEVGAPEVVREQQRHLVQQPEAQPPDRGLLLLREGRVEGDVTPLEALRV